MRNGLAKSISELKERILEKTELEDSHDEYYIILRGLKRKRTKKK
jgi:hypothetical protein